MWDWLKKVFELFPELDVLLSSGGLLAQVLPSCPLTAVMMLKPFGSSHEELTRGHCVLHHIVNSLIMLFLNVLIFLLLSFGLNFFLEE
jgi:ABC-type phosphate transport system permease subunit